MLAIFIQAYHCHCNSLNGLYYSKWPATHPFFGAAIQPMRRTSFQSSRLAISRPLARFGALLCAALLAGCGTDNESAVRISVIDASATVRLEARKLEPFAAVQRAATSQGLVRFNSNGEIVPALAERWIVTDDGRSFIFRLQNATWANGDPVSSDQVARALRQRIAAERRTRLAPGLNIIRDIRAMTGRVIEIRLDAPKPDFLTLLAQPEMGIRRGGRGTGPLTAKPVGDWTEFKTPEMRDADGNLDEAPRQRLLFARGEPAANAIGRFTLGRSETVLGGQFQHLPLLAVSQVDRNAVRFDPVSGLFGLVIVENTGFLESPVNRAAISMAIDRSQLMTGLNLAEWQNTTRIVSPNAQEFEAKQAERWGELTLAERQKIAKDRVTLWKTGKGRAPRRLKIAMPPGIGSQLLFARIQADLAAIGLRTERVALSANADLRLVDEVAAYNKAAWYLNQFSCSARPLCDADADALLTQANRAIDAGVRGDLLADAEVLMTAANYYIPLGAPVRWSLVKPGLNGFTPTDNGWHPLPEFVVIPR